MKDQFLFPNASVLLTHEIRKSISTVIYLSISDKKSHPNYPDKKFETEFRTKTCLL